MSMTREFREAQRSADDGRRAYRSVWCLRDGAAEILSVEETAENKQVTIRLDGSLRSDALFFFKDELFALATMDSDVILDCEALKSISNKCQKGLIETQQLMDSLGRGTLTLVKLPKEILADFNASGVAGAVEIE